ncbi:GFA family protein [Oceanimonas baumannii]|uniref:CENP-V/GFA domain-containing protein n=1 Tax=Oceanimonas baumannii TaxID=129578 RepID=A0A235CFX5_9GAMM|nr:GFA family protein [Oceanimonas baumannii]OYD23366.1 hypothetical protein B6S09_12980 [Oceanimonas baumannii]TDW58482.1 hypothetical protein LY04_02258 [Oceanimonas baumannii]
MNYPLTGACQCGSVRYQLLSEPKMIVACHCKECQKLSTSAFSITALVNTDQIRFQGEMKEWRRTADSGNINGAMFCPTCGNRIYHFNPDEPDTLKLKPASLTDTRLIKPVAHVWVSEKQDWYQIPEGVAVYDKQP